ncbi:MAG TPA: hypothetical protein VFQ38_12005, partial [Longimicrobiales bacterium]|nr:hypothetical protein [Longimicrobiales bacterium]
GNRAPGDWGGLVIVGNALDNRCVTGGVCTLFTEGPQGTGQDVGENYGGGTDPNDNSGTLKYVRIEFAGFAVLKDQELNSVSSYVVGSGTQYDYVETIAGLDDAFEFFGGGAQLRHLISFETGDDHFDWSEGFQGKGQWMIALQTTVIQPRAGAGFVSTDPRGFEGDGCEIDKAGCTGFGIAPYSQPFFANFTIIGPGPGVFTPTDGNGMVVRRGSGGTFVNGVVARWPGFAISVRDSASLKELERDSLIVRNLVFAENGANFEPAGTNFGQKDRFANASITEATGAATSLFVNLPAAKAVPDIATIDFTPAAGGALASGGLTTFPAVIQARAGNFFGGSITPTSYVGAVDPAGGTNGKWWQGWTAYYTK